MSSKPTVGPLDDVVQDCAGGVTHSNDVLLHVGSGESESKSVGRSDRPIRLWRLQRIRVRSLGE